MSSRSIAETFIGSTLYASQPAVSPDGSRIAFTVTRIDLENNAYRSQVWIAAADGSVGPYPITGGDRDTNPAWNHNGTMLAFSSTRGEKPLQTTVHVLPIGVGGELRTLATKLDGAGSLTFSPDGSLLAFTSRTRDARYDAKDESWQPPRKIERFFSRLDNEGWVVDRPQHVYVVRSDGSGIPHNLTPGDFQHGGVSWLRDSSGVVTSAKRHDTWDLDFAADLYRVGLDGSIAALTASTGIYGYPSVSPDGNTVASIGAEDPSTYPQNMHVALVRSAGGIARFVSSSLDRTFECTAGSRNPVWETPTTLLITAEDRGQTHLYRVMSDGSTPVALTSGAITVGSFDSAGGTTVVTAAAVDGAADLFVLDGASLRRLTDFADRYKRATKPQSWERFAVPCTDGTDEIDAWIIRPADFDPDRRYPVIVNVHGGPHTQYGETLFDETQMQAAAGFVVVMCNPRGSSGREQTWGQAILGPKHPVVPGTGWGSVDVDDVLAVVDHALANFTFCDADRVGMQGGSYGGFMATWLASKHGQRFKAICSERAVNNMLSEEWSSDIGSVFKAEIGVSHLDDPAEYQAVSPVRWAREITTPMLLIHSENDLRCPINQAEELFMALRLLGRDATFYRFPAEGHELTRSGSPVHRVQRAEIVLDWFTDKLTAR